MIWHLDIESRQLIQTFEDHTFRVNSVAFSHDGEILASASRDTTIILWDVADGSPMRILQDHTDAVNDVTFSGNGSEMASASDDGTIIVWSLPGE